MNLEMLLCRVTPYLTVGQKFFVVGYISTLRPLYIWSVQLINIENQKTTKLTKTIP